MASPAQILRSVLLDLKLVQMPGTLIESGSGQLPGDGTTYCFTGSMPGNIDQCISIIDNTGKPGGRCMDNGERRPFPGTKLIIRTLDYETGYALAQQIALALDKKTTSIQTTVPDDKTTHYIQAVTREPITYVGEEVGNRRQLFVINAYLGFQAQEPAGYA